MLKLDSRDNTPQCMKLLDQLTAEVKGRAMTSAVRSAGNIVVSDAKTRIQAPNYPGDKPGKVPLSESIIVAVREYENYTVAFVGASWPEGAHGHLVEFGHLQKLSDGSVMNVPPYPWLRPAAEATRAQQRKVIESRLKSAVRRASK
ncbi:MAG: HK97 gp10 family phage protein [Planctomycetaceae bacterium]